MVDGLVSLPIPGSATNIDAGPSPGLGAMLPLGEFLVGPENRLVITALECILQGEHRHYHPIVFHAPPGFGKSHLALGLHGVWRNQFRHRPSVYATAVDFARELNDALETKTIEDFYSRYREASLLVLDDVHLLAGKPAALRELIPTLDAVGDAGGWAVLTSNVAPERLAGFPSGLQTRLLGGLAVPLALPGRETRRLLLERLAQRRSIEIPTDALEVLAEGLPLPVSGLAGALLQLDVAARNQGGPITLDLVRQYLAARSAGPAPTLREIATATAQHFSVRMADLRGPSRCRAVVIARGVAMYLARALTGKSLKQIGEYFAGRDHATVSHGCGKTEQLLQNDPAIRAAVEQLRDRLRPAAT